MKLLLIFTLDVNLKEWYNSGIFSREIALYKEFLKKNVEITFLTYGNSEDLKFSNFLGDIDVIPYYNLFKSKNPLISYLNTFLIPFKLRNVFRNVDIIKTNQFEGCWVAWIAKLLYRNKLIARGGYERLSAHISLFNKKGLKNYLLYLIKYFWIFFNELMIFKLANGIILTSEQDISFIIRHFKLKRKFKKGKIRFFPNYIVSDLFKPLRIPKKDKSLLFIGRFTKQKNLINLLLAFKGLEEYNLDIIGSDPNKNMLIEKVKEWGLNVRFLGRFPNNKIPEIINQYQIFILPSYWEGNPKVLLEAMSCGVACIGANVTGINNIINHKDNGYLCDTSPNSIKDAIISLFNDKSLMQKIGTNARAYILDNCSLKSISEKEYLFYKEILKKI